MSQDSQQEQGETSGADKIDDGRRISGDRLVYRVLRSRFEVPDHYCNLKPVGYGAYGLVVRAIDKRTQRRVAIKKNCRIFRDATDCVRLIRELSILIQLRHENMLNIRDLYLPIEDGPNYRDLYMVSNYMDTTLHAIIRNPELKMKDAHFKYFSYQILRALKFLHSAGVIHRDVKPANLLLNRECDLQICDFGLAREAETKHPMTDYVVTRYYRPPEILLACRKYDYGVDIWSTGCIVSEMMTGKVLFHGDDYIQQLDVILYSLRPRREELGFLDTEMRVNQVVRRVEKLEKEFGAPPPLFEEIEKAHPLAADFIRRMLVFDPQRRPSAAEMLTHEYLRELHDPTDEPIAASPFSWKLEGKDLSESELRQELGRIVAEFRSLKDRHAAREAMRESPGRSQIRSEIRSSCPGGEPEKPK